MSCTGYNGPIGQKVSLHRYHHEAYQILPD